MDGYIAGITAGLAQALTGHPLDTIKTLCRLPLEIAGGR